MANLAPGLPRHRGALPLAIVAPAAAAGLALALAIAPPLPEVGLVLVAAIGLGWLIGIAGAQAGAPRAAAAVAALAIVVGALAAGPLECRRAGAARGRALDAAFARALSVGALEAAATARAARRALGTAREVPRCAAVRLGVLADPTGLGDRRIALASLAATLVGAAAAARLAGRRAKMPG
jgi:hypothetical protein